MTEGERIRLYNDLCDYKDDLEGISYPSQSKRIDIIARAIAYVRGTSARWEPSPTAKADFANGVALFPCSCSSCRFAYGYSNYRFCPQCGSRIRRN